MTVWIRGFLPGSVCWMDRRVSANKAVDMEMQRRGNVNVSASVRVKLTGLTLVPFLDPRSRGSVALMWLLL